MVTKSKFTKTGNGADGFDGAAKYQMVPVGGDRSMSLETSAAAKIKLKILIRPKAGSVQIKFNDPKVTFTFPDSAFTLPPGQAFDFTITGFVAGVVLLSLLDDGVETDNFRISVKDSKPARFFVVRLADPVHTSNMDEAALDVVMRSVSEVYKKTSNTVFTKSGFRRVVLPVPNGLPDPLVPTDVVAQGIQEDLLANAPGALTDRFILVSTWNLVSEDGSRDLNGRRVNFRNIDFAFVENAAFSSTYVHEIGHAHNLPHDTIDTGNFMFTPFTPTREHFNQEQIDKINPSGT